MREKIPKTIKFEFTPPGTQQKNGVAESGFATHYSWMHAMMAHKELNTNFQDWPMDQMHGNHDQT